MTTWLGLLWGVLGRTALGTGWDPGRGRHPRGIRLLWPRRWYPPLPHPKTLPRTNNSAGGSGDHRPHGERGLQRPLPSSPEPRQAPSPGPRVSEPGPVGRRKGGAGKGRGFPSVFFWGGGGFDRPAQPPAQAAGLRIQVPSRPPPDRPRAAGAAPPARFRAEPRPQVRLPAPRRGNPAWP